MSDTVIGLTLSALTIMGIVLLPLYFMQKSKIKTLISEQEELNELSAAQKDTIKAYQYLDPVIDANAEAIQIVESANSKAKITINLSKSVAESAVAEAKVEASSLVEKAELESDEISVTSMLERQKAKDYVAKQTAKSDATFEAAKQSADKIIEFAQAEAKTIAGDALEAKSKADQYTRTVKAMRNTIDGYGDEYIIPCHSLLDDLAEDFSHKDAGVELKRARDHSKALIKSSQAAKCDYVEERRKSTAVRFIADAFNGKCDSILSKVKHDNYGKLQQAILDATFRS